MSAAALQLASYVADIEEFFDLEQQVLLEAKERSGEGGDFRDGLRIGAQSLWSLFEVERDIDLALYRLQKALRPFEMDKTISDIRKRPLLEREDSFAEIISAAEAILVWRIMQMRSLREVLLRESFGSEMDLEVQGMWERGLDSILRKSDDSH